MGHAVRGRSYDPATNTLSGRAPHGARVTVVVDGNATNPPQYETRASQVDGAWSVVLAGLSSGPHSLLIGLNRASPRRPMDVVKP